MGMDYYIMPKEEVQCANEFPEKLSQFFEQVGGYYESAAASQVSKILAIYLSIFQDIDYDVNEEEEEELHWYSIDEYLLIINGLLDKIKQNPAYYEQVCYEAEQSSSHFVSELKQIALLQNEQEENWGILKNKCERRYPPDYGYLSSGQII
jgi:hypothetical protein